RAGGRALAIARKVETLRLECPVGGDCGERQGEAIAALDPAGEIVRDEVGREMVGAENGHEAVRRHPVRRIGKRCRGVKGPPALGTIKPGLEYIAASS